MFINVEEGIVNLNILGEFRGVMFGLGREKGAIGGRAREGIRTVWGEGGGRDKGRLGGGIGEG